MTIDVIIPVYKPGKELLELISILAEQTVRVSRIILMNTEQALFEAFLADAGLTQEQFALQYPLTEVHHLTKEEFDHGNTRREGVMKSHAEVFLMMTQDALPADNRLIEQLVGMLTDKVAAAYARQLPREDCHIMEKYMRSFNYPDQSRVKSMEDVPELGIKTFFCSNVCAAYKRAIYEEVGGFVGNTIFNEDMIYAATAMKAGYKVAYAAQAEVIHSHNYTNGQQFHRNFDLGVSQAQYPEVFAGVTSESEGKKMVLQTMGYLIKSGRPLTVFRLVAQTCSKYAGYLLGKHYESLPRSWVIAFSDNKQYWK